MFLLHRSAGELIPRSVIRAMRYPSVRVVQGELETRP
jgi:hypothetical protein